MSTIEDFVQLELESRPHSFVDWVKLKQDLHINGDYHNARLGTYSLTRSDRSATLVSTYHLWDGRPVSASSVSRRILNVALEGNGVKRFDWNKANLGNLEKPQPLYCQPSALTQHLYYFDIKSAYWDIYRRLPLQMYYSDSAFKSSSIRLGDASPVDLGQSKIVRNSLVGCFRSTHCLVVKGKEIVRVPTRNRLLSPSHWGFMSDLLHALASYAIDFGAIYYNTDGAIFTSLAPALKWVDFVRSQGLTVDLKAEGLGRCWGVGRYSIGKELDNTFATLVNPYRNINHLSDRILELWQKHQ